MVFLASCLLPADFPPRPLFSKLTAFTGMCNSAMEAACMVMDCTTPSRNDFMRGNYKQPTYLHEWGLQTATGKAEPNDAEWLATLHELLPLLQELPHLPAHCVQGPLTWRSLERKSGKVSITFLL